MRASICAAVVPSPYGLTRSAGRIAKPLVSELLERRDDEVLVLANQLDPAACHRLGALGDLTKQKHRLVKRHRLFLNSARVAENGDTVFKHIQEIEVGKWVGEHDVRQT